MIPVLIGVGVLVAGAFAAANWDDWFSSSTQANDFQKKADGKKVAILGRRETGKTRIFDLLTTNKIDTTKEYQQTRAKNIISETHVKIADANIDFVMVDSIDVGGSERNYHDWLTQVKDANFILYLINAKDLIENKDGFSEKIDKDIQTIGEIVRDNKISKVFLVITHSDEVNEYIKDRDNFENKIENSSLILKSQLTLGGKNKVQLVIGSLDNTENGKTLLKQIFTNL